MEQDKDWYKKLPEYEALNVAIKNFDVFVSEHEEIIQCPGCKICLDQRDLPDGLFHEFYTSKYPKVVENCSYKKLIKEHLSIKELEFYNILRDKLATANLNYVKVVNPNLYKKWTKNEKV